MPLTKAQLAERRNYIGASDVAAIMGYHPYRTPEDIRLSKVMEMEPDEESDAAWLGNVLEQPIINAAADRLGWEVFSSVKEMHPDYPFLCANPDAMGIWKGTAGPEFVIEAKTAGLTNPMFDDSQWGDPPFGDIPMEYRLQVMYQMAVSGTQRGYVVALVAGRGLQVYEVKHDPAYCQQMIDYLAQWWERHVVGNVECGPCRLPTAERVRRNSEKVTIPDAIGCQFVMAKKAKDEKAEKEAKAAVLQAMGTASEGVFSMGVIKVQRYEQEKVSLDILRLKNRSLADEVVKVTPVVKVLFVPTKESE